MEAIRPVQEDIDSELSEVEEIEDAVVEDLVNSNVEEAAAEGEVEYMPEN